MASFQENDIKIIEKFDPEIEEQNANSTGNKIEVKVSIPAKKKTNEKEKHVAKHITDEPSTMEGGVAYFQYDMTYKVFIDGVVNDQEFKIVGEGSSKYPHGDFMIHAVCETGKLPMSWKPLCHLLQYGMPCFARYPNGITHFAQECFPEGFTVDRTVRYEDDGTMTSHHTYELDGSRVISKVTVQCEDFDPEGAIMNDEIVGILSTNSHMFPSGDNAVRQLCHIGFTKNDGSIMMAHFDSKMTFCGSRKIKIPKPHFVTIENKQMKDEGEKCDHIIQREINVAHPATNAISSV